ncbi:MAG: carboxypeptidase-like regulatory domain-containing protein, partial [Planctomycetota bacterium]
ITELSPGEHRIIAYVTEHDSPDRVLFANSEPVTARAGDTGIRLVIGDIPGSSVSGHLRVAGNGGQVQFMLTRADDDGHDGSLSVHLAPGDFQFPAVRAGSYEAWLWLGGHDSPELTFTVLPGEPTRLGEIFLDVIPPIRGRVLDESGRPISGAKVVRFDPRLLDFFGEQVPENAPTSDVDGRFEAKMDQDFWSTWLVKDGFAPVNIENLPKGSDLEIRLRHSGSILLENVPTEMEGWQTWHECLVPDSELGVYADQAGWISGMDDEPTRSFKDLPYGRWRIHLWKSDSDSSMSGPPDEPEPRVYLRFELEVRPGETTRFDLKSVW